MSLTANQLQKTMMNHKINWQADKFVPPYSSKLQSLDNDENAQYVYDFEPQRIRQFEIEYNKVSEKKATQMKVHTVKVGSSLN